MESNWKVSSIIVNSNNASQKHDKFNIRRFLYNFAIIVTMPAACLASIKKLPQSTIIQIVSSVWKLGSRDIRDVLKIAKLYNPTDSEEDINRLYLFIRNIAKLVRIWLTIMPLLGDTIQLHLYLQHFLLCLVFGLLLKLLYIFGYSFSYWWMRQRVLRLCMSDTPLPHDEQGR